MSLRILLDKDKVKKILEYADEFVEVYYIKGTDSLYIYSETIDNFVIGNLKVMSSTEDQDDIKVRFKSAIFKGIDKEQYMDLYEHEEDVDFIFYNRNVEVLYKVGVMRQSGVIDVASKLELLQHASEYENYSLEKIYGIANISARLGTSVTQVNGMACFEFLRSYVFIPAKLPNFCIQGKVLKRVCNISSTVKFIGRYIYVRDKDTGIDLFISKLRVGDIGDFDYLKNKKFSKIVTISTTSIQSLCKRFTTSQDALIYLDLNKEELRVVEESRKFSVNCKILDKVEKPKEEVSDDLIANITSAGGSVDLKDVRETYPILKLPRWVMNTVLTNSKVKVLINSNFIGFMTNGYRVIISRVDVHE